MRNESTTNPYESPQFADNPYAADSTVADALSPREKKTRQIGELFLQWERLRVFYNLALLVTVVPLGILQVLRAENRFLQAEELAGVCIAGCIGANCCFLFGHYITAWLVMLGAPGKTVMVLLFWCGIAISVPIALIAVLSGGIL